MDAVNAVVNLIQESNVFYLATEGESGPDVRPMGIALNHDNRFYFVAATPMNVHKQLQADGKVAISAYNGDKVLRLSGTAVLDRAPETVKGLMAANERIAKLFAEDTIAPYYLKDVDASIGAMGAEPERCRF